MQKFDIAIIGAGVVGAGIAYHLTHMGAANIVLLEKETHPGSGSTARANGGIRAQFTTDINIRMSLLSMRILDELAADIGEPPVYIKAGYLFLTANPEKLKAMQEAVDFQKSRGVDVELLDNAGVQQLVPYVHTDDVLGGTFGSRDGFIDPGGLCNWLLRRSTAAGVKLLTETEVTAIRRHGNSWRLTTTNEDFVADSVVNCAGPYARDIAALVGIDLPVYPVRRHLFVSGSTDAMPPLIPMVIDADTGVLIRREGPAALIAYSNADEPRGFNEKFDQEFIFRFADAFEHRFPIVADAGINFGRSWMGHYAVSPDHHAVLGPVPGAPGFHLACGFSGHGVMHAPATGRCMAELLLNGASTSVDTEQLSVERFASGSLIHETMVL